nr:MAG TPA: hypothetical protein [Caudoviricetes sp.]
MSTFFGTLGGIVMIVFIVGMIKPGILRVFKTRKKVAAVLIPAIILLGIATSATQTPEQLAAAQARKAQKQAEQQKKDAEEQQKQETESAKKDDVYHKPAVEHALQDLYEQIAEQNGIGAPKVDVAFSDYRQWESAPGLTESDGTFTLSSERGLTHKFSARWGRGSNELIRLTVDGQKIFYSEELQEQYMNKFDTQNK